MCFNIDSNGINGTGLEAIKRSYPKAELSFENSQHDYVCEIWIKLSTSIYENKVNLLMT